MIQTYKSRDEDACVVPFQGTKVLTVWFPARLCQQTDSIRHIPEFRSGVGGLAESTGRVAAIAEDTTWA